MATLAEFNFALAAAQAAAVRQTAYAAAFAAYGYVQANYTTYVNALATADAAYYTAMVTASGTNHIGVSTCPDLPGCFGNLQATITS